MSRNKLLQCYLFDLFYSSNYCLLYFITRDKQHFLSQIYFRIERAIASFVCWKSTNFWEITVLLCFFHSFTKHIIVVIFENLYLRKVFVLFVTNSSNIWFYLELVFFVGCHEVVAKVLVSQTYCVFERLRFVDKSDDNVFGDDTSLNR